MENLSLTLPPIDFMFKENVHSSSSSSPTSSSPTSSTLLGPCAQDCLSKLNKSSLLFLNRSSIVNPSQIPLISRKRQLEDEPTTFTTQYEHQQKSLKNHSQGNPSYFYGILKLDTQFNSSSSSCLPSPTSVSSTSSSPVFPSPTTPIHQYVQQNQKVKKQQKEKEERENKETLKSENSNNLSQVNYNNHNEEVESSSQGSIQEHQDNTLCSSTCQHEEDNTISMMDIKKRKPRKVTINICNLCPDKKVFKRREHLNRHMLTHTGERPFSCPVVSCGKSFNRIDNLSQHLRSHARRKEITPEELALAKKKTEVPPTICFFDETLTVSVNNAHNNQVFKQQQQQQKQQS